MSLSGDVKVVLESPSLKYTLSFNRNISIISGDSGTGKSLLCELLELALAGSDGLSLQCIGCNHCIVMPAVTMNSATTRPWFEIIANSSNSIIFIDEFCDCLHSGDFARTIKGTTNYYVLITRKAHSELPYSVHSIYNLSIDKELSGLEQTVIVNEEYVDNTGDTFMHNPQSVLVEDKGTGAELFERLLQVPVKSADSKTRVFYKLSKLLRSAEDDILVVVDGAAFEPHWESVYKLICSKKKHVGIYLPESVEWLLLHSLCFMNVASVADCLANFLVDIDYTKYFSAETYFTAKLTEYCNAIGISSYDKGKQLCDKFTSDANLLYLREKLPVYQSSSYAIKTNCFGE